MTTDLGEMLLGHPLSYWRELEKRFAEQNDGIKLQLKAQDLLEEVLRLRGKLNFYESRIVEMWNLTQGLVR